MKYAIATVLLLGVATTAMAKQSTQDVRVTNDGSEPVPVTVQNPVVPPSSVTIDNDEATPVPEKNVNEPGREPYNEYIEYSEFGCGLNCTDFYQFGNTLLFNGPAVPPGKRLVVQWVSGVVPSDTEFNSISFQETTVIANQRAQWQYHGPFYANSSSGTLWGMNSGAFFTVEPGEPLRVRVQAGSVNSYVASISVGGYLIDAE